MHDRATTRSSVGRFAILPMVLVLTVFARAGQGADLDLNKLFHESIPDSPFIGVVYAYVDAMLEHGRDTFGPRKTGMLLGALDRKTLSPLETRPTGAADKPLVGANPQLDQNLLRLLYFLKGLSGEDRYPQAADAELRWLLTSGQSPETGLLPWGEHLSWDVMTDTVVCGAQGPLHEFSRPWMLWDRCFELAPRGSKRFALGLWNHHVVDQKTGAIRPRADLDGKGSRPAQDCPRQAGFLIRTWAEAFAHTGDEVFLTAIEAVLTNYENKRSLPRQPAGRSAGSPNTWDALSLAIDCDGAARKVPEPLRSRLIDLIIDRTDQTKWKEKSSNGMDRYGRRFPTSSYQYRDGNLNGMESPGLCWYSGSRGRSVSIRHLSRHYRRSNLESEIDMRLSVWTGIVVFCAIVIGTSGMSGAYGEPNWPRWRGPAADGHSPEKGLPHKWTKNSVVWSTPLKGRGHSSPTIWGERVFLTSALDQGKQRMVICIDRTDGAVLWESIAWTGEPERSNGMNGWASATCATDGEHVYAFFGRGGGLHCHTVDGERVWSRDLGRFESPWGTAASPLLVGEMVIQNCDSDQDAYVIALDKKTGGEVWRTERPDHRGWSSPILIPAGGRDEIVVNGHTGVIAYAPDSGKELWRCDCDAGRGSPTVTFAHGLLYAVNGLSGGGAYCVRPGGNGDVTRSRRLWITRRGGRDLPSPIVVGETMLVAGLRGGILTAYDTNNGNELWVKRIDGQVSASPVSYDGLAFFLTESGDTVVVDPESEEKITTVNSLAATKDELFRASITPCDGKLFLRSDRRLYCIEAN